MTRRAGGAWGVGAKGRNQGLIRVLTLMRRIEGLRYLPPLGQLAQELGVCPRTVRRDLQALEVAGHPVPAWRFHERPFLEIRARDGAFEAVPQGRHTW